MTGKTGVKRENNVPRLLYNIQLTPIRIFIDLNME